MSITYEGATEQVRQIVHQHAVLRRGLELRVGTLCEASAGGVPFQWQMAALRGYLDKEILPHAEAEERTLYQAAATQARGGELVRILTAEHHTLAYLAGRLQPGADGDGAVTAAEWIATLFAGHVAKENDLLLPALTSSGADLASLLVHTHEPQASTQALGEIIMNPDSALSAWQLAIMAVVVTAALAAWLILVFLAAREPRGTSAPVNAGPGDEETDATVTQIPSGGEPSGKAAA